MSLTDLAPLLGAMPPLLLVSLAAVAVAFAGGLLRSRLPMTGALLRGVGNLALIGVLVLAALRFVRIDPAFDALVPQFAMPVQRVAGGETRVPLSADGHYWIEASVNGTTQRFMVDTGATISALSAEAARESDVKPDPLRLPVLVRTANGTTQAHLANVEDLRFGNVVASDLDAIITGSTGGLNVLGMNFLARLKSWRVEDGVLILTPRAATGSPGTNSPS